MFSTVAILTDDDEKRNKKGKYKNTICSQLHGFYFKEVSTNVETFVTAADFPLSLVCRGR